MLNLHEEMSNFRALELTLVALEDGENRWDVVAEIEEFINSKRNIATELEQLSINARRGCNDSAKELISKMAQMNDGI